MSYPSADRLHDRAGRALRARRIAEVLVDFAGLGLAQAVLLDVGAAQGLITLALAERVEFAVGVDVDAAGMAAARGDAGSTPGVEFLQASGMCLPFRDECFDVVICNHVYEHVCDAARMMDEIARVLRPGGVCYFAGGHRLQVMEPHYRLPFLSWLPRPVAGRYLRLAGRGQHYQENFLPPWRMRELFTGFGRARDITGEVFRSCFRYGLGPAWLQRVFQWVLPDALARRIGRILPTHLWLLYK